MALWLLSSVLPRPSSSEASSSFSQDFLAKARRRSILAYLDSGLSTAATFFALYVATRIAGSRLPLPAFLRGEMGLWKAAALGFLLGAAAILFVEGVNLPFGVYGFYLDRSFGLSRMTLAAYLLDYAKATMLGVLAYSFGGGFTALMLARFPRTWHLILAGAFFVASVAVSAVYPTLIAPMFDKFHPLEPGPVLSAVEELASAAGMKVDKVLVMEASAKTSRVNAYFTGIGSTKQVVLYDTLLASSPVEQVRLVLAHELGHWKMGHVVKGLLASAGGALIILWLAALALPGVGLRSGGTPGLSHFLMSLLLFATLASYALSPATCYLSRVFEARADAFSLELTRQPAVFISTQVNLARGNLSDVEPPAFIRWFAWTHPTTLERIRSASVPR